MNGLYTRQRVHLWRPERRNNMLSSLSPGSLWSGYVSRFRWKSTRAHWTFPAETVGYQENVAQLKLQMLELFVQMAVAPTLYVDTSIKNARSIQTLWYLRPLVLMELSRFCGEKQALTLVHGLNVAFKHNALSERLPSFTKKSEYL